MVVLDDLIQVSAIPVTITALEICIWRLTLTYPKDEQPLRRQHEAIQYKLLGQMEKEHGDNNCWTLRKSGNSCFEAAELQPPR